MPDAGEVKAKVVIEYDPSGIDQAMRDLEKLRNMAGTFGGGGGGGGSGGAFGGFEQQAASVADQLANVAKAGEQVGRSLVPLNDAMAAGGAAVDKFGTRIAEVFSGIPEMLRSIQAPAGEAATALQELQSPLADMPKLLEAASSPFLQLAERAGTGVAQISSLGDALRQLGSGTGPQVTGIQDITSGVQQLHGITTQAIPQIERMATSLQGLGLTAGQQRVISEVAQQAQGALESAFGGATEALTMPQTLEQLRSAAGLPALPEGTVTGIEEVPNVPALPEPGSITPINPLTGESTGSTFSLPEGMQLQFDKSGRVIGPAAQYIQDQLNGATNTFQQNLLTAGGAAQTFGEDTAKASQAFEPKAPFADRLASGDLSTLMSPLYEQDFARALGAQGGVLGRGGSLVGGLGGLFGEGGFLGGLGGTFSDLWTGVTRLGQGLMEIMWPAQMITQGITAFGQSMYNAAVIAEGPAAHSFGSFTGQLDQLGRTSQQNFGTFSESFGQQMMPSLMMMNAIQQGGGGASTWWGNLLGFIGNAATMGAMGLGGWMQFAQSGGEQRLTQLGENWTALAGQYPTGSYLQGPPGWIPNPPGYGPQPGPGAGPSTLAWHWYDPNTGAPIPGPIIPPGPNIYGPAGGGPGGWFYPQGWQTPDLLSQFSLPSIHMPAMSGMMSGIMSQLMSQLSSGLGDFNFGGISLPSIHLPNLSGLMSALMSQLSSGLGDFNFGGISLPSIHLPNIGAMLSPIMSQLSSQLSSGLGDFSFSGISLPPIPNIGGMLSGLLSQLSSQLSSGMGDFSFSGISLPPVPNIGGMLSGLLSGITSQLSSALGGFSFTGISIPNINFSGLINAVQNAISGALSGLSALGNISIPGLPHFASGIQGFSGGLAVVGESGPELLSLPPGSSVYPMTTGAGVSAPTSLAGVGGGGSGPQTINFSFQLDSQTLISAIGIPLASTIRLSNGFRAA